jgi:hypothetical protein
LGAGEWGTWTVLNKKKSPERECETWTVQEEEKKKSEREKN